MMHNDIKPKPITSLDQLPPQVIDKIHQTYHNYDIKFIDKDTVRYDKLVTRLVEVPHDGPAQTRPMRDLMTGTETEVLTRVVSLYRFRVLIESSTIQVAECEHTEVLREVRG